MLDTVNVDTSTTDVDTGGMSEQQREVVTSCHPSGDKQPSSPVYRNGDGNRCEDDSDNLDGLAENMCKSCCISSDGQKESVDAKEETNSTQQKASFVGAKSIEGDQKKVSSDQEDIEGDLRKVSAEDEDIEGDQKEVSADDGEIGNGQKDVSVDEEIMDNQKNVCVEDESKNNKEKVKEDGTSGDRNDVDQFGVRGQDDGEETKELSVSGSHREGVEHECPSPTDWETGEASDDDDVDDSDAVVVTVMDHHGSDSDEEEVTKVTEDMMCLRLQAHVQVFSADVPGPQGWLPRSPNGKPMPPDYNDILLNVFGEDGLFGNDGQRNDGTRKRDRTDDISMPTKYMPFSDDDSENFIQKLLDDEFVINTDDMATLAEINGVDSPNILSPAEQRVPSPSHYISAASPCDSASSPIGSNAPSPWHSADDTTADNIVSWLDDMVDILDKDLSAGSSNTGTLLQQTQPQLHQQNQAPIQLQQHMQQIPVAPQEQHQAPMQLQQIPVQIQQHNKTPVQLQQHNQTPVQLQQHNQTPVQLQQHMQQSPVQLQQHNQSTPNWLLGGNVTGSTVLQHQHLAQSPIQLQQHNQAQLQQQNQDQLQQHNQTQLQQHNQTQLQQHNQTQLQQQNQIQLQQHNQAKLQQHNQAQLQQQNQAQLQQQNQAQLQQQNQAQLQQQNQAQLQQQNQAQLQQQNQAQLQQQNQAQLMQQNQAQLQQQNQAQLQQQNQTQMQQQNQTQMQQQNQTRMQQQNQAQLQQQNQAQLQQQNQAQLQQQNQAQLQQQNQAQLQQQNQAQLQQQIQAQLQQQNQTQMQQHNQAQLQQQNQTQVQQQNQAQLQQQNQAQLQQQNHNQLQQHTQTQLQQQKQAVEHLQQQIQQLQQQVPLLQRRLQFLQCQKKQAPEHQQQQFDKELAVKFQKYQQLIQFIKQQNQQLQRLQTKSRNKLKPKKYADVFNKYPPIQPRPPMVVVSPPVMTTVTSQTPTSPALTLIATLSPGNPNSPSSPGVNQGGLSPCLVSSPQSYQVPSSPVQYSPQPLSPQLMSPTSPQQLSPQMLSPVPSPQQNASTSVKQDAIIVLPGSPVQMSAQQYTQQQTSPLPFSPQQSPQPCSPQMPSPQLSVQPNPAPFVKQELVTTSDHAGPSEFPLNINPDMRTKAERYIAALSLDELKYVDPEDGDNMLHLAVIQKMPVMLVALVSRCVRENILGSLINSVNRLNQTPLYIATVMNLPEIVAYLLSHDANPNIDARVTVNGLPPINQGALHCAARKGHAWFDTLAQLLKSPHMDIDKKDSDGQTPLHCAMMTHGRQSPNGPINSKDMIKLLMSHEADLNTADGKSGKTPLHYAIERKDLDLLEFVLDLVSGNSAKILNTPTYDGNCSLHIAVGLQMLDIEQHKKIVRLLMRRGADASHKNNSRHLPRELVANRNQEIINILRGVNTTLRTTSQSNPMLMTNHIILAYPYQQV